MWLRDVRKPEMHLIRLGVRTHLYCPGLESKFKYSALYGSNASEECLAQRTHIFCIACRALRNDNQFFFLLYVFMYQSNRSFNIPSGQAPFPGQPPGHLNFWKSFLRAEKLFKCPHIWENCQITVLTFQWCLSCF